MYIFPQLTPSFHWTQQGHSGRAAAVGLLDLLIGQLLAARGGHLAFIVLWDTKRARAAAGQLHKVMSPGSDPGNNRTASVQNWQDLPRILYGIGPCSIEILYVVEMVWILEAWKTLTDLNLSYYETLK